MNRVLLGTVSGSLPATSGSGGNDFPRSFSIVNIPNYESLTNNNFFLDFTYIDVVNGCFQLAKSISKSGATVTVYLANGHYCPRGGVTSVTANLYVVY